MIIRFFRHIILGSLLCLLANTSWSQTGTNFWFAPPEVTSGHGDRPVYLIVSSLDVEATVRVNQPANSSGLDSTVTIASNSSIRIQLDDFLDILETSPTNTVLQTGVHIVSDETITAYYEVSRTNNSDIFALKGPNGLGTEFYIPLQTYSGFRNQPNLSPIAYASFDIVATENNTVIRIYSPVELDGHAANTSFTITLNEGETYSGAWTGTGFDDPANHPSGASVTSNKPIAITIKDDSAYTPRDFCYDLLGDQIVPVDILGTEYIAVKGFLGATDDESVFVMASENNTEVFIDGSTTPSATLFAGETFQYDIDYLDNVTDNAVYIETSKPSYVTHVTGFGCEAGQAVLPSLTCAGSEQASFVRTTNEGFFLNIFIRDGAQDSFTITGNGTATIDASDFISVPGSDGEWVASSVQYNTTEIPSNTVFTITNTESVFTLGLINGGSSSGCRYGFFSEFSADVNVDAGVDQTICANDTAQLVGTVTGGTTTGVWTTNGSGTFIPSSTDLNAEYIPSEFDASNGNVNITLTSTGNCTPVVADVRLNITGAPIVTPGNDMTLCSNNSRVNLNGAVTVASGGIWLGGAGLFSPNNTTLDAVYTPTVTEIQNGRITLTLTSTGNNICNAESEAIDIRFTEAPSIGAGQNQTVCGNNADVTLSGDVNLASGGIWSGGIGSFIPSSASLSSSYTPSASEVSNGSVTLTLTSTGNGFCNSVSDDVTINFSLAPSTSAGTNRTLCANNASTNLIGVSSTGTGEWVGGFGTYSPSRLDANTVYTPSIPEIENGNVVLSYRSTNNANCNSESDLIGLSFTPAPVVNAGNDQTACANNPNINVSGSVTIASGGIWSTLGDGTFGNVNILATTYTPSQNDIQAGEVNLILTSVGNGSCNAVRDTMLLTLTSAPVVNAGVNQSICKNNNDIQLNGSVQVATGGDWSGGTGVFTAGNSVLNTLYIPSLSDLNAGQITLRLTSTGNGLCNSEFDELTINFTDAPVVNAGSDQTLCGNNAVANLQGDVFIASDGIWSGGSGVFIPSGQGVNTTYTPTESELNAGVVELRLTSTGNGNCSAVSDVIQLNFTPAPTIQAGNDVTYCANNATVSLNSFITVAVGGIWSTLGTGFFENRTDLATSYEPSLADIANGSVRLALETTGNGRCNVERDTVEIELITAPEINLNPIVSICENNPEVQLGASVIRASGGIWTGGTGQFIPSNTDLNAQYIPTSTEINTGQLQLFLTTTGNGLCNSETTGFTINFTPSPTTNAGVDKSICRNNVTTELIGEVTVASGGEWTGGSGTFFPVNDQLMVSYTPAISELNQSSIELYFTSTGNGNCNSIQDTVLINLTDFPTVDAGQDQIICSSSPVVNLSGAVTVATGGEWSGNTGTFSTSVLDLTPSYTLSAAEIAAGEAILTLTTTGNDNCNAVLDQVRIGVENEPQINAGPDLNACTNNASVELGGNSIFANGIVWSGGGGTFNPSIEVAAAIYTPSIEEQENGVVNLTISSTNSIVCPVISDQMTLSFITAPEITAGKDSTYCSNNANVILEGGVLRAVGGTWSGGLGTYIPSRNVSKPQYTPTQDELTTGSVNFSFISTGNGICLAEQDDVEIRFSTSPSLNAGADVQICDNNTVVQLNGQFTGASGIEWTGGLGNFLPNSMDPVSQYIPTDAEVENGILTLRMTTTGNGDCNSESDELEIQINSAPIVNAGGDQMVCVDDLSIQLAGIVSGITQTGIWSTVNGTGMFTTDVTNLNATYLASSQDSLAGEVILDLTSTNNSFCNAVSSSIRIQILPAGLANAGSDLEICANNALIQLDGSISGTATNGVWSTSGTGAFVPNENALNARYFASNADTVAGSVTLTLSATSCNQALDETILTIVNSPVVNAGVDQTTCVTDLQIDLNGMVSGATTTGEWTTTGTGMFIPNNEALNATYIASAADSLNQGVSLILTATGADYCAVVRDSLNYNILPSGIVQVGTNLTLCGNNGEVQLNGQISGGATTALWQTSGTGDFVPNAMDVNGRYIPSRDDERAREVTLTLEATDACNQANDERIITYTASPVVNVGDDIVICGTNAVFQLNASINNALGGIWSTSGSGSFSGLTDLNAVYTASAQDIANGGVVLNLRSSGNGDCNIVREDLSINITNGILVNAGADQTICSTAGSTNLGGIVGNGSITGRWETLGGGSFNPDSESLDAAYQFSGGDLAAGFVELILRSTNNGECAEEMDTVKLIFGTTTFADAGRDIAICENNLEVVLSGTFGGGAQGAKWTTLGGGSFTPDNLQSNSIYNPDVLDSINGEVQLVYTTTGNGQCEESNDTLTIEINRVPKIDLANSFVVCPGIDQINLSVSLTNSTSGVWETQGTGQFENAQELATVYSLSEQDQTAGNVVLKYRAISSGVCSSEIQATEINVINDLEIGYRTGDVCQGNASEFFDTTVVKSGFIETWNWSFGDGRVSRATNPINLFSEFGIYDVQLKIVSSAGCEDSLTKTVSVFEKPIAGFTVQNSNEIQLKQEVQFLSVTNGISTYIWRFGEVTLDENIENPSFTFQNEGTYKVVQIVESSNGCKDSIDQVIEVQPSRILPPKFPTGFSPNEDGQNDLFYPRGGPFQEFKFTIYNEWGGQVFESNSLEFKWDGKHNGKEVPVGVYIYTFEGIAIDNESYSRTGEVTLIR